MKKILLVMLFAFLALPVGASANGLSLVDLKNSGNGYVHYERNGIKEIVIAQNSKSYAYKSDVGLEFVVVGVWKKYIINSNGTYDFEQDIDAARAIDSVTKYLDTDIGVYKSSTTMDGFFFSASSPYVITTAEQIPTEMKKVLVDGGLISTGLMVLAILLGVSLIPRLVRLFAR